MTLALHDLRHTVHLAALAERDRVGGWSHFRPQPVVRQFAGHGVSRSTVYEWISESRRIEFELAADLEALSEQFETLMRDIRAGRPVPAMAAPWDGIIACLRHGVAVMETVMASSKTPIAT